MGWDIEKGYVYFLSRKGFDKRMGKKSLGLVFSFLPRALLASWLGKGIII